MESCSRSDLNRPLCNMPWITSGLTLNRRAARWRISNFLCAWPAPCRMMGTRPENRSRGMPQWRRAPRLQPSEKIFFSNQLWDELAAFKSGYDYYEHGENLAKHTELPTDSIIDGIAIAGTPEEVVPKFQAIADMGIDGFVCPAGMEDAMAFLELFGAKVVPRIE